MMVLKLLLVASVGLAAAHDDWGEKCPDPLHMEESQSAPFHIYDANDDGGVTPAEVIEIYKTGRDDEPSGRSEMHAKLAFESMDADSSGDISEKEFAIAGMTQMCVGPKVGSDGNCPSPFIKDGEVEFFKLQSEHFELRSLHWNQMIGMKNDELRGFMRTHEVPFTVRTKVLDLHDAKGGKKNEDCVPVPPMCHKPLEFHEDGTCQPPKPHFQNPIIDDTWVSASLVVDGAHHNEKAPRAHQPVENDPNDAVMVSDRKKEENRIWPKWEKVRRSTAH